MSPTYIFHRAIKGFLFTVAVQKLFWKKLVIPTDYTTIAKTIYDTYIAKRPFEKALQAYFDCCRTLDDIGSNQYVMKTYFLIAHIGARFSQEENLNRDHLQTLQNLAEQTKKGDKFEVWYHPKIAGLALYIQDVIQVKEYLNGITGLSYVNDLLENLEKSTGNSLEDIINQLSHSVHEQRKYGIKPAYFQDGALHRSDQAWVVVDNRSIIDTLKKGELHSFGDKLCRMYLADKASITSLKPKLTYGSKDGKSLTKIEFGIQGVLSLSLDQSGHIHTGGFADIPVQDIARESGRLTEYELLRLASLYRIYNLVVPIEIAKEVPTLPTPGNIITNLIPGIKNERIRKLLDPSLLIPRLKSLDNTQALLKMLEEEVTEAEKSTDSRRVLVEHEVVGHARKLLPGHHASAKSIANATEDGVTLQADETYVALHLRGKGGQPQSPHKAIIR